MTNTKQFSETIRALLTNVRALVLFSVLYALLLASLYIFVATREATIWQVTITFLLLVIVPVEFFVLQSSILIVARTDKLDAREIAIGAAKIFAVTIPMLVLGYVIFVLLNKWQVHYPAPKPPATFPPKAPLVQPTHWPSVWFATARILLLGVVLPLATVHLWIAAIARDFKELFSNGARQVRSALARAFTMPSVLAYALGLIVFALIPYALLFWRVAANGTKTDFAFFIFRLLLVFVFTLSGWILTLIGLSKIETAAPSVSSNEAPVTAEAAA
jgi:hypothetical protein